MINTNYSYRKYSSLTALVILLGILTLFSHATAQTIIFQSGFEATDPILSTSFTQGTPVNNYTITPRTGTYCGHIIGPGGGTKEYDGSLITPLINFTAGKWYEIKVYAKTDGNNGTLSFYKNITATNAAMKASLGNDIIHAPAAVNVTSTAYTIITRAFLASATESKYVGFQMYHLGGSSTAEMFIDDITITEYDDVQCSSYCPVNGTSSLVGEITNVLFNTINNTTSFDGYVCTGASTTVVQGNSYDLSVTRLNNSTYPIRTAAWIDFNQDGDFSDAGENVMVNLNDNSAGSVTRTISVLIPGTSANGVTRMRVCMKYNADIIDSCDPYSTYIDWEDYTIIIVGPPSISTQPTNQSMCQGSSVDFTLTAAGLEPMTYQWKYGGVDVVDGTPAGAVYSNANTETLTVSGVIAAGVYSPYTCYIVNALGNTTSNTVQLTVTADIAPATPTDVSATPQYLCSGSSTLSATVGAGETLQWYSGNCDGTLETSPVSPAVTTTYYARAFDAVTGCFSPCADITVGIMDSPEIISNPANASIGCNGTPVSFSVISTGAGLTFQWQEDSGSGFASITDGGIYSGATTENLIISDPTGLDGNTYRCVITGTCTPSVTSTSASLQVLGSGLSGIKTVGSGGNYTTLKAAFDDINANGLVGDLELQVVSSITDNNEAILNQWDDCGNNGYTLTIYPTGIGPWTLDGSVATSLVTLNGADNVTFNGKLNQTGTANNLILSNTNTSGSTVKFISDATYNTIKYATIKGVSTSATTGTIWFSTGTTSGNDYNTITYCDIRDGATVPKFGIYALGTSASISNDKNTISYCNIFNQAVVTSGYASGIWFDNFCSKWTITYNNFYQQFSRTDNSYFPMYLTSTAGDEFNISNNNIGGTQASCGGTPLTLTYSGSTIQLFGIYTDFSTAGVSYITNNVIKNISVTCTPISGNHVFAGIAAKGRVNVENNTIGDNGTGSITITLNDYLSNTTNIAGYYKLGNGFLENNYVGSITVNGTSNDLSNFRAVLITGTITTDILINNNTIGSATTASSISTNAGATPVLRLTGIEFGTGGSFNSTVSNNTVANIQNNSTSSSTSTFGISNVATGGTQRVLGNNVFNISSAGTSTLTNTYPVLAGIKNNNTTTGNFEISDNRIHSLSATGAAAINVHGILLNNATTGTNIVRNNFIHSIYTSSNSSEINGIFMYSGTAILNNNMIRLGLDKNGNSVSASALIRGIYKYSASSVNCYFNSVYLGGAASAGAVNTYGFQRVQSAVDDFKNNILVNARTGGTGKHYGIVINATTTFTSDYNDLYTLTAANLGSYNGGTTPQTFANWQAGIIAPKDANSISSDPSYTAPTGNAASVDLHISSDLATVVGNGLVIAGMDTDYDGQQRSTGTKPNGPTIGADERVIPPSAQNAYGIFLPEEQSTGNIVDCEIYSTGGTPGGIGFLVADPNDAYYDNVGVSTYQIITEENIQCMNTDIDFTTVDITPDWLLGNGSNPSSGSTSPVTTQYTSTGRKDIIESLKVFTDFINITMDTPDEGTILGAPAGAGCPTTYSYSSSEAGSAGYSYLWSSDVPGGCSTSIASPTSSSTDITFVNQTGSNQVFTLYLDITTECCGPLKQVVRYITIYPGPAEPTVGGPYSICSGGSQIISVTGADPSYAYDWYDAATAGNLLGSGSTYTESSVPSGVTSYFVQATNSFGCASDRTEVTITGTDTPAPTISDETTCGVSDVSMYITGPTAGYEYNWYSGSCGGTLLQTGTATSYTMIDVAATTTLYVSATPPGCGEGLCATPTITYDVPSDPVVWLGVVGGTNNWFEPTNWTAGCLPTCGANVRIPNLAIDPDIGFNSAGGAACNSIELQSGAELSFSDPKAELTICGNFDHAGILTTNNKGTVIFGGSVDQSYTMTGSGKFNALKIDNSDPTPIVTIAGANNMVVSNVGSLSLNSGVLTTGSNMMVVENPSPGSVAGQSTASYVNGYLRRYVNATGTYEVPVGNAVSYQRMKINLTANTANYITTNFTNNADGAWAPQAPLYHLGGELDDILDNGDPGGDEGYWIVTSDGGTSTYDLTLYGRYYSTVDIGFTVVTRPDAASDWGFGTSVMSYDTIIAGVVIAERTGFTDFSHKAIATSATLLPIKLTGFNATCRMDRVYINWTTESEENNDYFTLERSKDNIHFETLEIIDGAGTSHRMNQYSVIDNLPEDGESYYRLKQTDYNGQSTYSEVVVVDCGQYNTLLVFPNPFEELFSILIGNYTGELVKVSGYDATGRLVFNKEYISEDNSLKIDIDMSNHPDGIYMISVISDSINHREMIIKE